MKIIFLLLLFAFLSSNNLFAQTEAETQIKDLLQQQEISWNNGDLRGFMHGYWESDSLMFMGKSGITYGWQNTLDKYIKGYPDTASMGKLHFKLLELKPLSPEVYFVAGKWDLTRSAGNLGGYFSLLFKKINGEWKIICDHTS
jgi:ketosteroid isomerase-like protein